LGRRGGSGGRLGRGLARSGGGRGRRAGRGGRRPRGDRPSDEEGGHPSGPPPGTTSARQPRSRSPRHVHETRVPDTVPSVAWISLSVSTRSTLLARANTAFTRSDVGSMPRLSSQKITLLSPLIGPISISWRRPTQLAGTPE